MWSSEQTREHVGAVSGRIAASAPVDLRELLLLVAAVHEERDPDRLREAAQAAGAGQLTDAVAGIASGFGEIWTLTDDAGIDGYIERHAAHLRALLLFELAHEGAPTETMTAVAERAGVAHEVAEWQAQMQAKR
ncbi:MAG: hypothetical protein ACRDY6_16330 [Acidimicrobiia bacterium]